VGSIAFGLPVPAVDGNVLRVATRIAASEANTSRQAVKNEFADFIASTLPKDRPGDFNQALMELGAMVCLPNGTPLCGRCPCAAFCKAHLLSIETSFPVKDEKKSRTVLERTVFVLTCQGRVALRRRPAPGLLGGLWELPGVEEALGPNEAAAFLRTLCRCSEPAAIGSATHIFTHREWRMTGYTAEVYTCKADELVFVSLKELAQDYCLPTAFRFFSSQIPTLLKGHN
jgi:A/G-specific adenine glycosylase